MENYIFGMLADPNEAQDELRPCVVDGEAGPLEACAVKIGEALTAVNYWQWSIENGGAIQRPAIESTLDDLHSAQDSAKEYLDITGWKDSRACDAFTALDQAIDSTENFLSLQQT